MECNKNYDYKVLLNKKMRKADGAVGVLNP